jgi:hypothetical protein
MKTSKPSLTTALAGVMLAFAGIHAQAGATQPASLPSGMPALYAQVGEIEALLSAGKLDDMHKHAEAIDAAAKMLDRDSTLDATHKRRVQGYVKNLAKLADKMHDAADGKKLDETRKAFSQVKAQVDLLDKQFAHSHKPAAALQNGSQK